MTFLGRLHPLVVHLPIGFLAVLAMLMLASPGGARPGIRSTERIVLWGMVLASIAATLFGLALAAHGSYGGELLGRHRTLGILTAAGTMIALIAHYRPRRRQYGLALAVLLLLTGATAHYGGSLTHGRGYLTQALPENVQARLGLEPVSPIPAAPARPDDIAEADIYTHLVEPIFATRCMDCHGPRKAEGGLRMDSFEALMAGGDSGEVIDVDEPRNSELLRRLSLPLHHDDRMPPESRTQLTADEIDLLTWWIGLEAPSEGNLREYHPRAPESVVRYLQDTFDVSAEALGAGAGPGPVPVEKALALAAELGIVINRIAEGEPGLEVSTRAAGNGFGDGQLERLAPIREHVRWLDLSRSSVSDEGLAILADMYQLERLNLSGTAAGDGAVRHLDGLPRLAYLNLHGTAVTDRAFPHLKRLPSLRRLYLWESRVSPAAAAAFAEEALARAEPRTQRLETEIKALEREIERQAVVVQMGAEDDPPSEAAPPASDGTAEEPDDGYEDADNDDS